MSQIGSHIAINAAQVAHQATQVSRTQDKRRAETQRLAQDSADSFEHRLYEAADADEPDAELPDRQAPGYEQLYLKDGNGQPLTHPRPEASDVAHAQDLEQLYHQMSGRPEPTPSHPLYEHLDVTA